MKHLLAQRLRVEVEGTVQGVGFRPFVYRLAHELELTGWVLNTRNGALIEVEGESRAVETFLQRLQADAPVTALIETMSVRVIPALGDKGFSIGRSAEAGQRVLVIPPDLAACEDCRRELHDPRDRRFRYPFLTCTQCGPRYSLLTAIPYERSNTTMAGFELCSACRADYETEADRRFHAEPIACPLCGPRLCLWDEQGHEIAGPQEALRQAHSMLDQGLIVAVKGLGGFQLWVDAQSEKAVRRLRERKRRPEKPFAVLFPSVDAIRGYCLLTSEEEALLRSPQAPIVLVRKRRDAVLAESVAPGNPYLGVMLPATPLHHLLMASPQRPMVATSGNRSEEPIVTDEREALVRLKGIADALLVHDRPIARPVDDSVALVVPGKAQSVDGERTKQPRADVMILRRARGYVPQSIRWNDDVADRTAQGPILAVGGHLKNTVALLTGNRVVLSQHLGDLSTMEADKAFRQAVKDLQRLLEVTPRAIACDLHPDYRSTGFARELVATLSVPLIPVQHHHAHVVSCMAEHRLGGEVLGIAWDGAGYGGDGQVWGGEFLIVDYRQFTRFTSLKPFRLLGGEAAMKEPGRSAAAVLWELMGEKMPAHELPSWNVPRDQREKFAGVLKSGIASPWTTSMGRLYDAVAALTGLCHHASFEGQAAMAVQFAAEQEAEAGGAAVAGYPMDLMPCTSPDTKWMIDWRPMVGAMLDDLRRGCRPEHIAARFHAGLAAATVRVAQAAGLPRVALTGGCFQNRLLLSLVRRQLEEAGFAVYSHALVPPNDGGLSLGQAVIAAQRLAGC
ncbi:carbamoyltransferase HypF [Candidatus Nitrospira nitrificans]|uniref:Carbamoyltransferase n=1 Tax=Candidatus Nitrospira nitrificans TaxID=1742973 RepID=A0A0S4LD67_9BACT|nr:carbamoyltransferase HypF [Candidatus Nitrospira nitrificans]CUS35151.1 Carbamoyltransferase HypF [Candidatus Nitrospira nitrificans]